jgi:hypothetical protein
VGKVERCEEDQGEKFSRVLLHQIEILNSDFNRGRVAFGEVLLLKAAVGDYFRAELRKLKFV